VTRNDTLRSRVIAGDRLIGTFLNLGSSLAAEACAIGGLDWLLVDLEHGGASEEGLLGQVLAAAVHGVPVVVRVESADRIRAGRALDLGVSGVMFPRLDTHAEVAEAIGHLRYPPDGDRGVANYNRARRFSLGADPLAADNEKVLGVVQIESVPALRAAHTIASTDGVDVLFIGPGDLSLALGIPGQLDHPIFVDAVAEVLEASRRAGKAAGILAATAEAAAAYLQQGLTFVAVGSDSTFVARAAAEVTNALKEVSHDNASA
jgi:4-hydroxy-2-oxoheptanedioate aldolase